MNSEAECFFLFENFLSPSYSCLQNIDHIGSYAF